MKEASKGALRGAGSGKGAGEGKLGEPALEGDSRHRITSGPHPSLDLLPKPSPGPSKGTSRLCPLLLSPGSLL